MRLGCSSSTLAERGVKTPAAGDAPAKLPTMSFLSDHVGSWIGTNGFRLMPTDAPHVAAATADVSTAAAGNLTTIAYTWSHPDDGAQEGLLLVGRSGEAPGAVAFWADSWHQQPDPVVMPGEVRDQLLTVSYAYGGDWRWQVTIDGTDLDALTIRMDNIVPESAAGEGGSAGAYSAMATELRRVAAG
jgi:hypothetical protein